LFTYYKNSKQYVTFSWSIICNTNVWLFGTFAFNSLSTNCR